MNKVILMGRLTRDPESRMTSNGLEISRFSLACDSDRTGRDGQRDTQFINCVAFGTTASTIDRFVRKGQQLLAQGRIRNGSYDAKDGTKRYTTDIVVDAFEFVGSRGTSQEGSSVTPTANNYTAYSPTPEDNASVMDTMDIEEDPYKDFGNEYSLNNDDLPF